jgi:hypothetical protein
MHGQPVRVEAFVVRHIGIEWVWDLGAVKQVVHGQGLIYECDTKLQMLGDRKQPSGGQGVGFCCEEDASRATLDQARMPSKKRCGSKNQSPISGSFTAHLRLASRVPWVEAQAQAWRGTGLAL